MNFKPFRLLAHAAWALLAMNYVAAQASPPVASSAVPAAAAESRSINDWLMRMHEASRKRAYIGTFVVSSGGAMSSAKIWHVCEGNQQVERVDTLTGAPRSIFRHNDQVVTFMPDHKVVPWACSPSCSSRPTAALPTSTRSGRTAPSVWPASKRTSWCCIPRTICVLATVSGPSRRKAWS